MKKFLSLIIWTSFLFSATFVNANNFSNLWEKDFYYWTIFWEKEWEKSIFLLKEKDWTIHQLFSSQLASDIEKLFKWKNNIKILGQSYKNPNNEKYAWVFVNKLWNLDEIKKIKEIKTVNLSENEKTLIYFYLAWNKSSEKFSDWKKIFWDINLQKIYKEMDQKAENWELNLEFLEFVKSITTDSELQKNSKTISQLKETVKEIKSLDSKILWKVQEIWLSEVYKIFTKYIWIQVIEMSWDILKEKLWIDLSKKISPITNSEKYILNELFTIKWYLSFLVKKMSAKSAENNEIYNFSTITLEGSKEARINFLFKNFWKTEALFSQKWEDETVKEFTQKIKNKIIFSEICKNLNIDENLHNKISQEKLEKFLSENNSEEILKNALSKDFQSKDFWEFKINFPQNFDYQEITIWNETFSRIYLKSFYSNILSFDFNKVEKFEKRNWEKSSVKLSWNYWEKIISDEKIYVQIKNNSWEKFEIFYSTQDENFQEIFENILNKIGN